MAGNDASQGGDNCSKRKADRKTKPWEIFATLLGKRK